MVNAKNGLTRVIFELDKDTKPDPAGDKVVWTINFQLFKRDKRSDEYGDALVNLDVEVDTVLNKKAEAVAASNALTPGQVAHVLGPAADDAVDAHNGDIIKDAAGETVRETLKVK